MNKSDFDTSSASNLKIDAVYETPEEYTETKDVRSVSGEMGAYRSVHIRSDGYVFVASSKDDSRKRMRSFNDKFSAWMNKK